MAVRETLDLSLDQALRQVSTLERQIDDLRKPVVIPVDLGNSVSQISTFQDRLQRAADSAGAVGRELATTESTTSRVTVDLDRMARALGISGDEARDLSQSILESQSSARRVSDAAAEVAQQLGLSKDEARRFTAEMGRAATQTREVDDAATRTAGGMDRLSGSLDRTRAGFSRLAVTAVAFVGVREIARFANQSIQAFSNLEESTSKAEVVFGDFANTVFDFTSKAPTQLGSTRAAAIEMAASFGNLFLSVGLGKDAAADMSTVLVQLGTDLASFNNISVDEALGKIQSGLVGQAEPLREVGVLLSEAAVAAKGLELGLGGATGKLSEAEKVQARYAIILAQTVTAQGDFARTAEGIANAGRTAEAIFGELQARIGEGLAPAFAELVRLAPDIAGGFDSMVPSIAAAALALADFFAPKPGQADLIDIVTFLTDLGRGFGQIIDTGKGAIGVLGGLGQAASGGLQGNLRGVAEGFGDVGDALQKLGDSSVDRTAIQFLVQELRAGEEPATSFANAIALIARQGTLTDKTVKNLTAIAGLDTRTARAALVQLLDAGDLGGTAQEIAVLTAALEALNAETPRGQQAAAAQRAEYRAMAEEARAAADGIKVLSEAQGLTLLRTEADLLGISLSEVIAGGAAQFPELAVLIGSLEPATVGLGVAQENLATFAATFETTNTRISNAIDEFGKLPDKLDITKNRFLANLTVSAAEEAEFQAGLVELFNIAPALATRLQQQGPAARQLVEDFLKDATGAQRAESIITGNAEEITGIFTERVRTSIEESDLDATGSEALRKFLEGFGNTAIAQEGVSALQTELQRLFSAMRFQIDGSQFAFEAGGPVRGGGFAGPGQVGGAGGGVTINNTVNYPAVGDVPTAVAQMNQSTSAVATSLNRIGAN